MKNINSQELRDLINSNPQAVIIDVRTSQEAATGMIPKSMNINLMSPTFTDNINALDKSLVYIMVCQSGNRSGSACGFMSQQGFEHVYNLTGGMMAWDEKTL